MNSLKWTFAECFFFKSTLYSNKFICRIKESLLCTLHTGDLIISFSTTSITAVWVTNFHVFDKRAVSNPISRISFIISKTICCSVRILLRLLYSIALHDSLCLLYSDEEPTLSKFAFGTTSLNRPTFPQDIGHGYFANTQTPLRGVPNM